ncbi:hypothetical protein P4O66_013385 [Electrophorus voltai]|uniref:Reverse transcriptase/retrotransposon-derived protein RNase H-like domain-containing protein n=1 Tax=Electrophorus voltai TaxID=2609070 RepID=A0AAD9DRG3_9TELE|nr:hypothetical protein P4O66_013385 [Electrophorus voltai]
MAKVWAVENWPRPTSVHLVQCFLGFTNFYCRFIKNFSMVATPLTALTRKASEQLCWSTKGQQAFKELKHHLIMAPILQLPDAELPFIIEVDASEVGVGAVLSQRSGEDSQALPLSLAKGTQGSYLLLQLRNITPTRDSDQRRLIGLDSGGNVLSLTLSLFLQFESQLVDLLMKNLAGPPKAQDCLKGFASMMGFPWAAGDV